MESYSDQVIGSFNPSENEAVDRIKMAARELVDAIDGFCPDGRRKDSAVTQIELAQMIAVKSLFQDNV